LVVRGLACAAISWACSSAPVRMTLEAYGKTIGSTKLESLF
jgi:hypothetical protein